MMVDEDWEALSERINTYISQFRGEPDRVAVILVVARLDFLLRQCISQSLMPSINDRDELLDDGPLSTLSSRITMAFRLGITDVSFTRALHLFRKIRNDFAHQFEDLTFESQAIKGRLLELTRPLENTPEYSEVWTKFIVNAEEPVQLRRKFTLASAFALGYLDAATAHLPAPGRDIISVSWGPKKLAAIGTTAPVRS